MRLAHPTRAFTALAAMTALTGFALPGGAQAAGQPAAAAPPSRPAADLAEAPTRALHHAPLPPSGALATDTADWQAANAAVGAFPHGHADIVRWEAGQAHAAPPAVPPAASHHHAGGQP